jgi:hypothetical protein
MIVVDGSMETLQPVTSVPAGRCAESVPSVTPGAEVASSGKFPPLATKSRSDDNAYEGIEIVYVPSALVVTGPATVTPVTVVTFTEVPEAGPATTEPETLVEEPEEAPAEVPMLLPASHPEIVNMMNMSNKTDNILFRNIFSPLTGMGGYRSTWPYQYGTLFKDIQYGRPAHLFIVNDASAEYH